jgi:tetratricopeptide (TPR) repeat protein
MKDATDPFRQGVSIASRLAELDRDNIGYRNLRGVIENGLGRNLHTLGRFDEAEPHLRHAVEVANSMVAAFPEVPRERESLAGALGNLGLTLKSKNQLGEAADVYAQAIKVEEGLVNEHPDIPNYHSLAGGTLHNLARLLILQGKADRAQPLFEQAIAHERAALARNPNHFKSREFLRNHYWALADLWTGMRKYEAAAGAARESALVFTDNWTMTFAALDQMLKAGTLAEHDAKLSPSERRDTVRVCAKQAKALIQAAEGWYPTNATALNKLGWILATTTLADVADPPRGVGLAEKAAKLLPGEAAVWSTLGAAQYCAGQWKPALESLERSMKLSDGGDADVWVFVALAHWRLGNKAEALRWYEKASHPTKTAEPEDDDMKRFHREAEALMGHADSGPDRALESGPKR